MELHITPALALLREHHLLDHVSNLTDFTATSVSYDSRKRMWLKKNIQKAKDCQLLS